MHSHQQLGEVRLQPQRPTDIPQAHQEFCFPQLRRLASSRLRCWLIQCLLSTSHRNLPWQKGARESGFCVVRILGTKQLPKTLPPNSFSLGGSISAEELDGDGAPQGGRVTGTF